MSPIRPDWPGLRCNSRLPQWQARLFNKAPHAGSRGEGRIRAQNPTLKMTSTKIELSFNRINRLSDLADLAELLFPRNRNHQHAFLAIWLAIKWADCGIVPNLAGVAHEHAISRRTLERVRAKMRRMGVIDHVSRFNAKHRYREGWVLSGRFERSLTQLAAQVAKLRARETGTQDKDILLLNLLDAARRAAGTRPG